MARLQRFLLRVRGTQRIILMLIVGYNLWTYGRLLQHGFWLFIAVVLGGGLTAGVALAAWLQKSQTRLEQILWLAGVSVFAVYAAAQLFPGGLPFWVFFLSHFLFWFTVGGYFWHESRPLELDLWDDTDFDPLDNPNDLTSPAPRYDSDAASR